MNLCENTEKTPQQSPSEESEGAQKQKPSKPRLALMAASEADRKRFWLKAQAKGPNECWEWNHERNRKNYGLFYINAGGYAASAGAHIAAAIFSGMDVKPGLCVCHTCDNPPCVNPAHLWLGTNADNMKDKVAKGRQSRVCGMAVPYAKLNDDKVREIRRRHANGETIASIIKDYGIKKTVGSAIVHRTKWKHVI